MSWRNELTVGILRAERIFYGTENGGLGSELDVNELGYINDLVPGVGEALKALVLDANADITSGINDFTIDGDLVVVGDMTLDDLDLTGDITVDGGSITVGVQDVQEGAIFVYGAITASTIGGKIELQTAADHDTSIDSYSIRVTSDDLLIGPSTDQDSLMYDGTSEQWTITGPNGLLINAGATGPTELVVGEADVSGSALTLHGMETGETAGAAIIMHAATDHDGDNAYYKIHVDSADFVLELADGTDIFKYDHSSAMLDIDSACYFTGLVGFDGDITGSIDMIGGALNLGQSAVKVGDLKIYGSPTGNVQGGMIRLQTADDHDSTLIEFFIQATSETLTIGSNVLPSAIEITASVINLNESLYTDHPVEFAGSVANLDIGSAETLGGVLTLEGSTTGNTEGGRIILKTGDDHDTTFDHFELRTASETFSIRDSVGSFISFSASASKTTFNRESYFDAPVEFGSAVANFEIGGNETVGGQLKLAGAPTSSSQGGHIVLYLSDDDDTTIASFDINVTNESLKIGSDLVPNAIEITNSKINLGEELYSDQPVGFAGNVDFLGTWAVDGTNVTSTAAELNYLDLTSGAGVPESSKALVLSAGGLIQFQSGQEIDLAAEGAKIDIDGSGTNFHINSTAVVSTAAELDTFHLAITILDISTMAYIAVVVPEACTFEKVDSVLWGTITTADDVLTFTTAAGAVTNTLTIAYSGSNSGDIDTMTPGDNQACTAGSLVSISNSAASDTAMSVTLTLTFKRS